MKTQIKLILSIIIIIQSCTISQNLSNKKACRKFEKELTRFESALVNDETIFNNRKSRLIWHFEELTGIGGNTLNYEYGILIPNKELLEDYNLWYLENKEKLFWNWWTRSLVLSNEDNHQSPHVKE